MQLSPELASLPALNGLLNGASAVLLLSGRALIRRGQMRAHRLIMLAALSTSLAFLTSYLYYHAHVGSVHFPGHGWVRPLYFAILLSHTILAIVIVPMVLVTLIRALRARYSLHRIIARWTFPLWMYVSITGVVIYLMLYKLFV
jgi:uncharacterized membrane protein YozB (DUF420 family)